MKKSFVLLLEILLLLVLVSGCSEKKGITVGSKQFTENILLGEIYAQLIEAKTAIPVIRKLNLGGTSVCMPAMEKGEIDVYFEYTGTAFNEILDHEMTPDITAEEILETSQTELTEKGFTLFEPLGLNNTYAIALKKDKAEELGVSSISDLVQFAPELKFGANHNFYTRVHDGYDGLIAAYGLEFAESLKMDTSLLYEAIDSDKLDVMVVYGTDSLLIKYEMTLLDDDKSLFPPYHGAPLCRNETLDKYPDLMGVMNILAGAVDDNIIQELNYQVDVENRSVEDVAREFLQNHKYID